MKMLFTILLITFSELAVAGSQPAYCLHDDGTEISEAVCAVLKNDHAVMEQEEKDKEIAKQKEKEMELQHPRVQI